MLPRAHLTNRPDLHNVYLLDQGAMPLLTRMMRNGFCIDVPYLQDLSVTLGRKIGELQRDIYDCLPPAALERFITTIDRIEGEVEEAGADTAIALNINSAEQKAELLFDVLAIGKGKELKRTKSGKRISTGKKQLEELREEHPIIDLLLEYSEVVKLKNTYADPLPKLAVLHRRSKCCPLCGCLHFDDHYRIHTQLMSTRTNTGRIASKGPNLQNIPIRSWLGALIRAAFCAEPGYILVDADWGQLELCILAHVACERVLMEVFANGEDPHTKTACGAFGLQPHEVDGILHRLPAKTVNFGVCYGMTGKALFVQLVFMLNQAIKDGERTIKKGPGTKKYESALVQVPAARAMKSTLTVEWCDDFIEKKFFGVYADVKPFMREQVYRARKYGYVWDLGGRIRRVPEVRSALPWIQGAGERQAGNVPMQGGNAVLMKLACYDLEQQRIETGELFEPILTIHDQFLLQALPQDAPDVEALMVGTMENVTDGGVEGVGEFRVKLRVDGKVVKYDDSGKSRWAK